MKKENPAKEQYRRLRELSCEQLWSEEVPAFDRADIRERISGVGVIRAVGVVFSESGNAAQKDAARQWLLGLLDDPAEKVRRYAMTALPKIGADEREESGLLAVLEKTSSDRERKFLGLALEKIGGSATLEATSSLGPQTARKVEANIARLGSQSAVRMNQMLPDAAALRIHLHCRSGLEEILQDELREHEAKFSPGQNLPGLIALAPRDSFALADVYALRCFSSASIVLGTIKSSQNETESLAAVITSPQARRIFETFTEGPIRYRLDFNSKGHQRAAVRNLAGRVYELCPTLLNDSRDAPWQINIFHTAQGCSVELSPRLRPDPRFAYRQDDVPAASHPPLAACMARLAGRNENETVWDPFCGSGLELIERARRGGVRQIFGTDLSEEAIAITKENIAAALPDPPASTLACCDFRNHDTLAGLESVSLIITNPPMGRRVPIPDLQGLINDLFAVAATVLKPGGRLVFANPLPVKPAGDSLKLEFRRKIDLGGFHVHLEKYVKQKK